jgi:tetratricopeptide (TPR) repeat protein
MASEEKAQTLVALGKPDEAKAVLEDALNKARSQQKRGHEAQVLILLGKLASQTGDRQQAIVDLERAAQFSKRVQFFRMEADAMFELATLYRDAGDLPTAEERATDGPGAHPIWDEFRLTKRLSYESRNVSGRHRYRRSEGHRPRHRRTRGIGSLSIYEETLGAESAGFAL